jgi:hypothetical protein
MVGAALSTSMSRLVVERLGHMAGFWSVTMVGVIAIAILWVFMQKLRS